MAAGAKKNRPQSAPSCSRPRPIRSITHWQPTSSTTKQSAGAVFGLLVLGGNSFGFIAPILTGFIIARTISVVADGAQAASACSDPAEGGPATASIVTLRALGGRSWLGEAGGEPVT
jgi:hypothetical protein